MSEALNDQNVEFHLVAIFEKLEAIKNEQISTAVSIKVPMQVEIRTLEFWRSVTSECLASFIYVFVVCGAAAGTGTGTTSFSSILLATALAAGFAATSLTQCFGHISGAHINPAVTVAMGATKRITVLRTTLFILAQCGGGIAGAAFLYTVTVPGYQSNLSAAVAHSAMIAPWERFGIEFILTFIVVFSYFVSMDTYRKWIGTSALTIGSTYSACSFVSMPYLNPARSLGPSFVLSKWENHWVYWLGPMLGGLVSGLIYEYIFNPKRYKKMPDISDDDSSSIRSDEDNYDDLDKPTPPKFHGSTYNTYRSANGERATNHAGYCPSLTTASLYSAPPTKLERVESIYGGTKSLYCKSPPLTRANLNRSQSVYTKSNSALNRDVVPKPGPLVPAQSLYPMRLNQNQNYVQNQNAQNQMQQRSESIYGVRGVTPGTATRTAEQNYTTTERAVYGTRANSNQTNEGKYDDNASSKGSTSRRPESMYGLLSSQARRAQAAQSDTETGYVSSSSRSNAPGGSYNAAPNYPLPPNPNSYAPRTSSESRPPPPSASGGGSYHHQHAQHSPNPQY
ncbi:unnamed protein product [Brassicogethes aeneus]|uniref:Big brain n=1 Tax=Brassicogethes aeneus TaxID=1431903 RepID=A0A9P0BDU1_BRAAE|nr:unnamed protein product [Brassicogethes aeneus]